MHSRTQGTDRHGQVRSTKCISISCLDSAFINLEPRLMSSVRGAIMHSSLSFFKSSFDSEIHVLKDKVTELLERIQQLESNVSSTQSVSRSS